jgi:hypothetical protein
MFEHRIENHQEHAHAGGEGDFLGLSRSTEAVVEGAGRRTGDILIFPARGGPATVSSSVKETVSLEHC